MTGQRAARRTPGWALLGWLVLLAIMPGRPAFAGDRYDLDGGREAALYGTGLLAGLGAWRLADGQATLTDDDLVGRDRDRIAALDRVATRRWSPAAATASDVLQAGMLAGPLLLLTETGSAMSTGDFLVMYSQTHLLDQAMVGLLKTVVGRPRPFVYNDDPRIPAELKRSRTAVRSFPSGHTATAFASAMFTGEVYARLNPDDPGRHWVRGGTLALAAVTGWLRVRAGRHYPTDVLAGAALGSFIGWLVPRLHEVDHPGGSADKAAPGLTFAFRF